MNKHLAKADNIMKKIHALELQVSACKRKFLAGYNKYKIGDTVKINGPVYTGKNMTVSVLRVKKQGKVWKVFIGGHVHRVDDTPGNNFVVVVEEEVSND